MLVVLVSAKGSPGVTTLAVALAACWPGSGRPVLVECDPSGGSLAVRFGLGGDSGLVGLAAAARAGARRDALRAWVRELPGGVRVVCAPVDAAQARAAVSTLAGASASASAGDLRQRFGAEVVIADCGRADPATEALVAAADRVLVVVRPLADDLAAVAVSAQRLRGLTRAVGVVLVGRGYPAGEVARELGLPVLGAVPRDEAAAAVLAGRLPRGRVSRRSGLVRAATELGRLLSGPSPTPVSDGRSLARAGRG